MCTGVVEKSESQYTDTMHLNTITSKKNAVLLFDFENFYQWFKIFDLSVDKAEDVVLMKTVYQLVGEILLSEGTGMSLSPHFGWEVLHKKAPHVGVVFPIEKKQPGVDPLALPVLSKQWTMQYIRNNYGIAKLELHYHPNEVNSVQKRKLVAELYAYALYENIDFILELKVKNHPNSTSADFQQVQLLSLKHFRQLCHAFILEDPTDALAAATITAELDVPWIAGDLDFNDYQTTKDTVRMLIENGARGAVIHASLIQNIASIAINDIERFKKELATNTRDTVLELKRIIEEQMN